MLPRYSCLFAEHVFDHLTSSSSPWLSKSDQDELKEAQRGYRSVDYDGDDCSEPNLAHDDMTEQQLAAWHRLYRSVCNKLISGYVPETASSASTKHNEQLLPGVPPQLKENDKLIRATFRQHIADRKVKELATMVLLHNAQILEGDPPRYPISYSHFIHLLHRCVPEFDRFPERRVPYCPEQEDDEIYNAIVFRWEYMMLTDDITARLGLLRPGDTSCALWHRVDGLPRSSAFDEATAGYRSVLRKAKCCVYPSGCQLSIPEPLNPLRYLCAALALAELSEE